MKLLKEKIFVGLFLFSLAGPTLIYPLVSSRLDHTNYEKRALAPFPEISLGNLFHIPEEFEAFYNDHVPFKNYFVRMKNKVDVAVFGQSPVEGVTIGEDGWLFYTCSVDGEDALADYQHTNLYTEQQEEILVREIREAKERFQQRGIRFLMFVVPNKETVYGEYMPKSIPSYGGHSRLDQFFARVQQERDLPLYYLKEALVGNKGIFPLYFKKDSHWNGIGAYVGAQQMAEVITDGEIVPEPLDVSRKKEAYINDGDLAVMLNLAGEKEETQYLVDYLPEVDAECIVDERDGGFCVYHSSASGGKSALVVGDSFMHTLKPYLSKIYKQAVFVTFDEFEPSLLEEYDVDDLVYVTVERNQYFFEHVNDILDGKRKEE